MSNSPNDRDGLGSGDDQDDHDGWGSAEKLSADAQEQDLEREPVDQEQNDPAQERSENLKPVLENVVDNVLENVPEDLEAKTSSVPPTPQGQREREEASNKKRGGERLALGRRQRTWIVATSVVAVLLSVGLLLSWINQKNYYFVCETTRISAKQGRFWPWGMESLPGPAYRGIEISSSALCESAHLSSRDALEKAFLSKLLAQSTQLLSSGNSDHLSVAEQQLEQIFLLTREPERASERAIAESLAGDVEYWHAAAQVQAAAGALRTAATKFSEAAAKHPRHSSDSIAWAEHAARLAQEIGKGPQSLRKDEAPREQPHFSGLSSTEPASEPKNFTEGDAGASPQGPVPLDAGITNETPEATAPAPLTPPPSGGVLL